MSEMSVPIQTSSGSVNALVMPEEANFKPDFLFGQPLLAKQSTIHFPGMGNNAVFMELERAEEFVRQLKKLPNGRPPYVERFSTYPCQVFNKSGGVTLRIEPLIGTADEAIYLRLSDIEKLGLEDTGKEVITRQGKCKIYQGDISFTFPDDYNAGVYIYRSQYAYGLSPEITDHIQTRNRVTTIALLKISTVSWSVYSTPGIIGVTLLHQHMTFLHRGDMHVIDLGKLSPFAKLFKSGLHGGPYFSTEGGEMRLTFKTLEDVTLDDCLAIARARPDPPFDYFNPHPIDSTFTVLEKCRTCGKFENKESKLFRCSKCSTERRSRSALYCSKDCQRADWKARHKEEHAGVREWDLGATIS